MNKKIINKRKVSIFSFVFPIFSIFFLLVLIFVFYKFTQSAIIKNQLIQSIENFSQNYNYTLKKIKISGINKLEKKEIEKYFQKYLNKSIFFIPIKKIESEILLNTWIDAVLIENDYNNTLSILINERVPKGIFVGNREILFDKNGKIIDFLEKHNFQNKNLIRFKGNKSILKAYELLDLIPPFLQNNIIEAEYINQRRWNIILNNGLKLKLDENNILESLLNYNRIYKNLSDKEFSEIKSIDLRMPKKVILKFKNKEDD